GSFPAKFKIQVLRHEEFEEGCKAACNGPYNGKWSKTMVGYGCEDDHFVIELTYNYEIGGYRLGNDYMVSWDFVCNCVYCYFHVSPLLRVSSSSLMSYIRLSKVGRTPKNCHVGNYR
ncbi:hypothetical protein ANCCEY_08847, partial [Ancylostoma ceylanicum]